MENKIRFSHTFDIPPMCDALIKMIGYNAKKKRGKQILDGTFVFLTGMPKYMQKVLDPLRKPRIVVTNQYSHCACGNNMRLLVVLC